MKKSWSVIVGGGLIAILVIALGLATGEHNARAEDAKTKSITIDYMPAGGMLVTFYENTKPEVRADFLKSELENYVRVFKPDHDYLATPFDGPGKNLGGGMIYVFARKQVLPVEQYQQGR